MSRSYLSPILKWLYYVVSDDTEVLILPILNRLYCVVTDDTDTLVASFEVSLLCCHG